MNFKSYLIFIFGCLFIRNIYAERDTLSIEDALKNNRIHLDIRSVGGYQGRCIRMKIKNLQVKKISLLIEAGRRLDSKDSTEQDILIIKDTMVVLFANQEQQISVVGYCCQAHNHSPKEKSSFTIGHLSQGTLYNLAKYISVTKLPTDVLQNAVWIASDNINPAVIVDDGSAAIQGLRKFISIEKKISFSWYNISFKKVKDKVFSGIPERITGIIDYHITNYSQVSLVIKDAQDAVVDKFDLGKAVGGGDYTYNLDWNIYKIPNQTYTLIIYQNDEEVKRTTITLNETKY